MAFANGEWTGLGIGLALLVLGVAAMVIGHVWSFDYDEESVIGGIIVGIIGLVVVICILFAGGDRYNTLQAEHDIQRQGYTVADIDLSQTNHNTQDGTVKVVGPGGCIVSLPVQYLNTTGYRVIIQGHLGNPTALTCAGG